ncbi:MAG: hypothetical protein KAX30_07685, partial [Candidatus Atribacteria bacterium]|nr:hypothetical protein [Candidatus Atribacteria bacterium]
DHHIIIPEFYVVISIHHKLKLGPAKSSLGGRTFLRMGKLGFLTERVDGTRESEVLFRGWLNIIFMISFGCLMDMNHKSLAGYSDEKERLLPDDVSTIYLLQKR